MNAPNCCLCDKKVEAWPGKGKPAGYGHNPDPYCINTPEARACNSCNEKLVIPARLAQLVGDRADK